MALAVGALGFVSGVGSLVVTLVLDKRNRAERNETGQRERDEREQTAERERFERRQTALDERADRRSREDQERWREEKATSYSQFSGQLYGFFDRVSLRVAVPPGDDGFDAEAANAEDGEAFTLLLAEKGRIELLAPAAVRDATRGALTSVTLFAMETRLPGQGGARAERLITLSKLQEMTDSMRVDLGVPTDPAARSTSEAAGPSDASR